MRNHTKLAVGILALAIAGIGTLRAQDEAVERKMQKVKGTIEKIDAKSVTIKNEKGKSDTFAINEKTAFGTKAEPKKVGDFQAGDVVLVGAEKDAKGVFVAMRITKPKAKPAEAPKTDKK